jgi:hypothetical protein
MTAREITCRYGLAGHEREYVVIIEGFDHNTYIPKSISDELKKALPDTTVLNRGSRIEVMTSDTGLGEQIITNIKETLFERPWLGDM